jgi:hypothetical protein
VVADAEVLDDPSFMYRIAAAAAATATATIAMIHGSFDAGGAGTWITWLCGPSGIGIGVGVSSFRQCAGATGYG